MLIRTMTLPGDSTLSSSRVLIVDDDVAVARLLEVLLDSAGFTNHRTANDSRIFFNLFEAYKPDLVLLDLQMPFVDGFAIIEGLAERTPPHTFLPILVLTGDATTASRKRALSSGASDFLAKPLDSTEVMLRVRNLLRTRWLYRELQRHNETLEERVRERTQQLADAQREILMRLATAAEYRDDATGEHTQRVGKIASAIAHELGEPDDFVQVLREAATLHDVGKIGIPDAMLMKPGRLTADEFDVVRGHARIGAAILGNSSFPVLQLAGEIALSHHEHWDGSGYPVGLRGSEIPLPGRIVAVADVFDALTHDRPYKSAWSIADALLEIRALSGTHLDPSCVDAFFRIVSSDGFDWIVQERQQLNVA